MTTQLHPSPSASSASSASSEPAAAAPATAQSDPRPLSRLGMVVLLLGAFLPMLDFFIVNLALPTIDATLHASAPMLELIVAGYGTAYAVSLVVGGRLGDAIGRRRMFLLGLAGFTLTSLLCGIAPSIGVLVGARVLQGVSAAMIVPQILATFQATLDGHARSRAIGLYAATGGIAVVTGQLLGGVLLDANIAGTTWRPIFLGERAGRHPRPGARASARPGHPVTEGG